jgi:hypothetical protein
MMWSRVLFACIPSALILSNVAVAQTTQDHPSDHRLQLVGARQLAVKPFSTLPKGVLFLRVENFSTTEAAHRKETSASAVVEWAEQVWLLTLGPKGERSRGGTFVAEIGPVPAVPPATRYVLDVNAAAFSPDMKAEVASDRRTVPRNPDWNDSRPSGRRNGRSGQHADATQHRRRREA